MVSTFRTQGEACARLGSPMYADLLGRIAADIEGGGVSADVLAGHEHDPGPSAHLCLEPTRRTPTPGSKPLDRIGTRVAGLATRQT
jgi:hypothetical protein